MPQGRIAKGRKYPNSLQMPCSNEFRALVERTADEAGMTVPEFMRRAVDSYMKDFVAGRDAAADDGWNNRK